VRSSRDDSDSMLDDLVQHRRGNLSRREDFIRSSGSISASEKEDMIS